MNLVASITDSDLWETPEREYEYREIEVDAGSVAFGDNINGYTVYDMKQGTKWTELRDERGVLIKRCPRIEILTVKRRIETQDSQNARMRANRNYRIAESIRTREDEVPKAMANLAKAVDEYENFDYGHVGSLITARAEDQIWREFLAMVHWREKDLDKGEWEGDLVTIVDEFKAELINAMSSPYRNRGISRSSNQLSNLMEDELDAARASFIHRTNWWL